MFIVTEPVFDRFKTSKLEIVALKLTFALNELFAARADVKDRTSAVPAPASTEPPVPIASLKITVSLPAPIVLALVAPPIEILSLPEPPE